MKKDDMHETDKPDIAATDAGRVREQLSAWLDGELPEAEAGFLLRRLEHDGELRQAWSRMHLAASCLRNQPLRPMAPTLPARVAAALATQPRPAGQGRSWHWAVAASVAALAILLAPRFGSDTGPDLAAITAPHTVPSLAAADLVSQRSVASVVPTAPPADAAASRTSAATPGGATLVADSTPRSARPVAQESPLPLDRQSPTEFPLLQTGQTRWPRSQLAIEGNDPALEAYLVRHNQMIASDGLSGFVPYVDVVASGNSADAATTQANDAP